MKQPLALAGMLALLFGIVQANMNLQNLPTEADVMLTQDSRVGAVRLCIYNYDTSEQACVTKRTNAIGFAGTEELLSTMVRPQVPVAVGDWLELTVYFCDHRLKDCTFPYFWGYKEYEVGTGNMLVDLNGGNATHIELYRVPWAFFFGGDFGGRYGEFAQGDVRTYSEKWGEQNMIVQDGMALFYPGLFANGEEVRVYDDFGGYQVIPQAGGGSNDGTFSAGTDDLMVFHAPAGMDRACEVHNIGTGDTSEIVNGPMGIQVVFRDGEVEEGELWISVYVSVQDTDTTQYLEIPGFVYAIAYAEDDWVDMGEYAHDMYCYDEYITGVRYCGTGMYVVFDGGDGDMTFTLRPQYPDGMLEQLGGSKYRVQVTVTLGDNCKG